MLHYVVISAGERFLYGKEIDRCRSPLATNHLAKNVDDFIKSHHPQGEIFMARSKSGSEDNAIAESRLEAVVKEADRYKAAQRQVTEALGVLWNSQLDAALSLGKAETIERSLGRPVELWNNCNCQ
jgi:hypothetical protein